MKLNREKGAVVVMLDNYIDAMITTPPSIDGTTFNNETLTVPNGCKVAYESAEGRSSFGTIVEMNN
jgi:hypothetical protein